MFGKSVWISSSAVLKTGFILGLSAHLPGLRRTYYQGLEVVSTNSFRWFIPLTPCILISTIMASVLLMHPTWWQRNIRESVILQGAIRRNVPFKLALWHRGFMYLLASLTLNQSKCLEPSLLLTTSLPVERALLEVLVLSLFPSIAVASATQGAGCFLNLGNLTYKLG